MTTIGPTRADEQAKVNRMYALGIILLTEWRQRTNELSEPTRWNAEGRIVE